MSPRALGWLRKLDHSAIFVLIAGSYTPLVYFGLTGAGRSLTLGVIWGAALAGVALKLITLRLPRWASTMLYLAVSWVGLVLLPHFLQALPAAALIWLGVAGLTYTVGALVYATRKLDFRPGVFGFHEVWHLFVLGGTGATGVMVFHLH